VSWDRQSLADFEARPVTELAKEYDVMIVDHPGPCTGPTCGRVGQRVDRDWGGYYSSTRRSLAAAWIRPRDDGWIGLQERAGVLVREAVTGAADAAAVVAAINDDYRMPKGGTR